MRSPWSANAAWWPRQGRRAPAVVAATLLFALAGCGSSDTSSTPSPTERRWLGPVAVREPAWAPALATNGRGDVRVAWNQIGAGAGIWSSALVSGQWSTAETVSLGEHVDAPQIAMSDAGVVLGVWREGYPFPYGWLKVARRASATGWEPPVTLNDGRSSDFYPPQLRVFDDGGALVVWLEDAAGVLARQLDPRSGWSAPTVLGHSDGAAGGFPVVWADTTGRAFVLWRSSSGWSARHLDPQRGWGAEEPLPDVGPRFQEPSIAVSSGGNIDVVWERWESGSSPFVYTSVWANRFVAGSGWTRAVPLAANPRVFCGAGLDPLGQLAVWGCRVDPDTDYWGTWYGRRSADGTWAAARPLASLPADAAWRMLAGLGGSSIALWSKGVYTAPGGLWAARLAPGGEWEPLQTIVVSGSVVEPVDLRMTSPGDGHVVWVEGAIGSDSQRIRSAPLTSGQWRPAQDVSGVARIHSVPTSFRMVVTPSGDAVAVWAQGLTGSSYSVWSNTYTNR